MPRKSRTRALGPNVKPLPKNDDDNYIRRSVALDSYQNVPARIGDGTPNLTNTGNWPLVRITEDYPLILSLYRSSWIVRKIIDSVANDMFKAFPVIDSEITPEQVLQFSKVLKDTYTVKRLRSLAKWGRLFGGAGAIIVIDGHDDLMQPLEVDDVEVGAYKGLIPLDRWSGIIPGPEINSNINDPANFGLPTYYNCIMDAGNINVHHSRILRFTGRELPQWEVQVELYWGMSEVEVIFDELKKRDYSSWNIVSLLTRSQIMAIEEPQLATLMSGASGNNKTYTQFAQRMEAISQQLNNNGLLILGKDGKLANTTYGFGGVSDVYHEFMKDLAAACGIPYEIIFGREAGLGGGGNYSSNGASSLQTYDDMIEEKRTSQADPAIDQLLPVIAMSTWGYVPDDLQYRWAPIRAISDRERSDLGKSLVESVLMAYNADLVTKKEARMELAQQSGLNGMFSNITQESIAETPDVYVSEAMMEMQGGEGEGEEGGGGGGSSNPNKGSGMVKGAENLPIEAKPRGVQGLKWHRARRLNTGGTSKTSAESLKKTMQHGIKHNMKS